MSGIKVDPDALVSARNSLGSDAPITMLNLLRFHDRSQYTDTASAEVETGTDVSGAEVYMNRYIPAWNAVTRNHGGAEVKFLSKDIVNVVGPSGEPTGYWHAVGLIQYKSLKAFEDMLQDPEYLRRAEPHRMASLKDWRLMACG